MTPRSDFRYLLPSSGLALEASWPYQRLTFRNRIGCFIRSLLLGGPAPHSAEGSVDPDDYLAALDLVEQEDFEAAAEALDRLGYNVTVRSLC